MRRAGLRPVLRCGAGGSQVVLGRVRQPFARRTSLRPRPCSRRRPVNCARDHLSKRRAEPWPLLNESGRAGDAHERLRRARAILSPLGVRPLLEEIEDLLVEEAALSS
jgi:hypothetical protein